MPPFLVEACWGIWHSDSQSEFVWGGNAMGDQVTTNQLMTVLEAMHSDIKAVYEGHTALSQQIVDLRTELKEDIALVDTKVMGLARRVDQVEASLSERIDHVEERLSRKLEGVRAELVEHRENSEMHRAAPKRRTLKKVA